MGGCGSGRGTVGVAESGKEGSEAHRWEFHEAWLWKSRKEVSQLSTAIGNQQAPWEKEGSHHDLGSSKVYVARLVVVNFPGFILGVLDPLLSHHLDLCSSPGFSQVRNSNHEDTTNTDCVSLLVSNLRIRK